MTLENKLRITDQVELARLEEKLSKQQARRLFDSGDIGRVNVGTFEGLSFIHAYLFGEICDFSGKVRDINIAKDEYLSAMERSPVKDLEIKALLKPALTDKIEDRALFMRSIDVSYFYEGYGEFKTAEL